MPDLERDGALLAPPELTGVVARQLAHAGIRRRPVRAKVVPRREAGRPNVVLDRRTDRWVADCPACPGVEVVPAVGPWVCGSDGTQAQVDWEGVT